MIGLGEIIDCDLPFPHGICLPGYGEGILLPADATYVSDGELTADNYAQAVELHQQETAGPVPCGLAALGGLGSVSAALAEIRATGHCNYYQWGEVACNAAWAAYKLELQQQQQQSQSLAPVVYSAPLPPAPTSAPPPQAQILAPSPVSCGAGLVLVGGSCVSPLVNLEAPARNSATETESTSARLLRSIREPAAPSDKQGDELLRGAGDVPPWAWLAVGVAAALLLRKR